jgi:hypothetical protein
MSQTISTGGQVKLHYRAGGFWWVKASSAVNHSFVEFLEENKSIGGNDEQVSKICQELSLKGTPIPEVKSSTNPPMPLQDHLYLHVPSYERIRGIYYNSNGVADGWYPLGDRPSSDFYYGGGQDGNGRNYYKWGQYTRDDGTALEILQEYASLDMAYRRRNKKMDQWTLRREDSFPESNVY